MPNVFFAALVKKAKTTVVADKRNLSEVAYPDGSWVSLEKEALGGAGTYGVKFENPTVIKVKATRRLA